MGEPRNPPAFPVPKRPGIQGMTLRDYFAGQALAGLLAADPELMQHEIVKDAYMAASAMLEERGKW
jgi:hypothetical protein